MGFASSLTSVSSVLRFSFSEYQCNLPKLLHCSSFPFSETTVPRSGLLCRRFIHGGRRKLFDNTHSFSYDKLGSNHTFLKPKRFTSPFSSLQSPPENVESKEFDFSTWKENFQEITQETPIPEGCTADELHWVDVGEWRLAMWRYKPQTQVKLRNHPILLLSGISTNAYGYDLDPEISFARYLRDDGFDTWILEVRGHGLSHYKAERVEETERERISEDVNSITNALMDEDDLENAKQQTVEFTETNTVKKKEDNSSNAIDSDSEQSIQSKAETENLTGMEESNSLTETSTENSQLLSSSFQTLKSQFGKMINSSQEIQKNTVMNRISKLTERLSSLVENGQAVVSPQVTSLLSKFSTMIDESKKTVSEFSRYDWDFDSYLNEDVPAAMDYIKKITQPSDGKILAVGHSLGGILLYSRVATSEDGRGGLKSIITISSAMDYAMSNTSLKLILPLAGPAEALQLPFVPVGLLCRYVLPFIIKPPYSLAWIGYQISAADMMDQALFSKLMLINFCTIPMKLLIQMATVFEPGGLKDRTKTKVYAEGLPKCKVPVLALSADSDLICPQIAVIETLKRLPENVVFYEHFGGKDGRCYGHYDLLIGKHAKDEVFPVMLKFLVENDDISEEKE